MREEDEQDRPDDQNGPVAGVQWSRKGGCLLFVRRKALWKKNGCEIEPWCDLLNKDPQTHPQELALAIGRSVSWVKKWRKRLRDGDSHEQELLCSHSRAYHAPYFRWNLRFETCIVEMRLSSPEHDRDAPQVPEPCSNSPAARSSPASRRGSLVLLFQPHCLKAVSENRVYSTQGTEEPRQES